MSEKYIYSIPTANYGADIVVDDEIYFIEATDGFDVGDEIEIRYLPKSKIILEIQKVDKEKQKN